MEVLEEEVTFVPQVKSAPKTRKLPSDLLDERSTFMRYLSRSIGHVPTVEELMQHADKFGTDQVIETAVELGYGLESCVRLLDHCDRADVTAFKKIHQYAKAPGTGSSEERCKALMGTSEKEGSNAEKNAA